jgi:ribosomal protein S14
MLFYKLRDFNLRKNLLKKEHKIKIYKFIFFSLLNKKGKKSKGLQKILLLSKKKYFFQCQKIKLIKRCLFNNRARGATGPLNISRLLFRNMLQHGLIPGYKKAVW